MKNFITVLFLLIFMSPSFASGVGYINYEKVAANYQFAQNSMKEIEIKSNEIRQYLKTKEQEFAKLETPLQKQKFEETVRTELEIKEKAFNQFREKREEEVYQRIHAVAEKIRLEKGLDVLIDARGVFSGGVDITDALIQKLNQR
ncbi:OmpH family outer membrane protein [bacterium]|nr:OmpH family outer membrane protein [bacterium]